MRTFIIASLLSCFAFFRVNGQPAAIDSLNNSLRKTTNDTLRLVLFSRLGDAHLEVNMDSALFYARQYLYLSQKLHYRLTEADAMQQVAEYLIETGSSGNALELSFEALQLLEGSKGSKNLLPPKYLKMLHGSKTPYTYPKYTQYIIGKINNIIGLAYSMDVNDNAKATPYFRKALNIAKSLQVEDILIVTYFGIAFSSQPDSAMIYLKKSYQMAVRIGDKKHIPQINGGIVQTYHELGDHASELSSLRTVLKFCVEEQRYLRVGYSYLVMAHYYYSETNVKDSVVFFGMKALQLAQSVHSPYLELLACEVLLETYKVDNMKDSAFKYLEMKLAANEKTSSLQKIREFQNADFSQQMRMNAIEATKVQFRDRVRIYSLLAGLCVFLLLAVILWRNNKHRQRSFALLQKQKDKTEQTLQELKSTQVQLIQSEKMASLGELTAGIAHEIQNPLNFVNNFSEVNEELLSELKDDLSKGKMDDAIALANNAIENQKKINHHSKRADSIVKGMLQHSRASSGTKEPTDINALCDEYLRLSYHGLRAKDKSFNAKFETNFDPTLGKVNVIPQDIGRVILNLINNAFYAVAEKQKQNSNGFEPTVSVSTKEINGKVQIKVADNGNGIPDHIKEKIFQPFFTTKPTGQGTGLGLSLSYDIVKAHGGELQVETKESEGSKFIIQLPG